MAAAHGAAESSSSSRCAGLNRPPPAPAGRHKEQGHRRPAARPPDRGPGQQHHGGRPRHHELHARVGHPLPHHPPRGAGAAGGRGGRVWGGGAGARGPGAVPLRGGGAGWGVEGGRNPAALVLGDRSRAGLRRLGLLLGLCEDKALAVLRPSGAPLAGRCPEAKPESSSTDGKTAGARLQCPPAPRTKQQHPSRQPAHAHNPPNPRPP